MELLSPGPVYTLVQNTVYALPARAPTLFSSAAVEVSNSTDSGFVVLSTSTTGGHKTSATFVRSTLASTKLSLKID